MGVGQTKRPETNGENEMAHPTYTIEELTEDGNVYTAPNGTQFVNDEDACEWVVTGPRGGRIGSAPSLYDAVTVYNNR